MEVPFNLGSTHGTPSESDVAPVSLQSRTYPFRFGTWKVRRLNQALDREQNKDMFKLWNTIKEAQMLPISPALKKQILGPLILPRNTTVAVMFSTFFSKALASCSQPLPYTFFYKNWTNPRALIGQELWFMRV